MVVILIILAIILIPAIIYGCVRGVKQGNEERVLKENEKIKVAEYAKSTENVHHRMELRGIKISKELKSTYSTVYIDDENKKWYVFQCDDLTHLGPFDYKDVVKAELLKDGHSVTSNSGEAIIGGMLFGVAGAVVGAATSTKTTSNVCGNMKVVITLNKLDNQLVELSLIRNEINESTTEYRNAASTAYDMLTTFDYIIRNK